MTDGIQMVLDRHPDLEVVGIATNSGDAVALASATHPVVILADYQLPVPHVSLVHQVARVAGARPHATLQADDVTNSTSSYA